jgi:mannose-6-phosphate isomerase class I
MQSIETWRKTTQELMPARRPVVPLGQYDLYPGFPLGSGKIGLDYSELAERLCAHQRVIIDGYGGVFWEQLQEELKAALAQRGVPTAWHDVSIAMRPEAELSTMIAPFLGGDDPLFGTRCTSELASFFDEQRLGAIRPDPSAALNIIYGCGAALAGWDGLLVYVDLPKNESQFRARAGSVRNLGAAQPADPQAMYKRFYFVDWVVLDRHKAKLLPHIDIIVDSQRAHEPTLMSGADLRAGLHAMSRNYFRVRPWFEPGAWGGQWLKAHVRRLSQDAPNYAWSFELIVPENGIVFESDDILLEVSFDLLMFYDHHAVLGASAERFGYDFPIRFDYLDTFDGGNLSIQCHPRPEYIRRHFGERFTQDETYYIVDCAPGARVYLGFQEHIEPAAFRAALEQSYQTANAVDIDRFVNSEPAHKHDLFLIPHGTVHSAGVNNLVLEISATPYIFTFKMYDWLRLDLDGRPRPLNIERAFENLFFERKGDRVRQELVAKPRVLAAGPDWQLVHLPTHPAHFYDIHRFDFATSVEATTDGSCHVLNVVEGQAVVLETSNGMCQRFNYAETFVVPAAAGGYRLVNQGTQPIKVVKALMKPFAYDHRPV